jgi:hypothetical protein
MKKTLVSGVLAAFIILSPLASHNANALSCLSVDMYLKDVVGKEDEIIIFTGTVSDQITEDDHTADVIEVNDVKQGYAENEVFVYHHKDETWGYMCNAGPAEEGVESLYITSRDSDGTYRAHQRLAMDDPLITTLEKDLKDAQIDGVIAELTKEDRMNQIMTTIGELFKKINTLFKEYLYLKTH